MNVKFVVENLSRNCQFLFCKLAAILSENCRNHFDLKVIKELQIKHSLTTVILTVTEWSKN